MWMEWNAKKKIKILLSHRCPSGCSHVWGFGIYAVGKTGFALFGERRGSLSGVLVQYQELTQHHVANCLSFDPHSWDLGVQRCPLADQLQKHVSKHWVYASFKLTLNHCWKWTKEHKTSPGMMLWGGRISADIEFLLQISSLNQVV